MSTFVECAKAAATASQYVRLVYLDMTVSGTWDHNSLNDTYPLIRLVCRPVKRVFPDGRSVCTPQATMQERVAKAFFDAQCAFKVFFLIEFDVLEKD